MAEKRKSPASGDALARGLIDSGKESLPNNNMDHCSKQNKNATVSCLLPQGKENAIHINDLMRLLNVKKRELYSMIEQERSGGAVILSRSDKGGGFFLPSDGDAGRKEIADWLKTFEGRAAKSFKNCRSAKEALETLDGQQFMEGL